MNPHSNLHLNREIFGSRKKGLLYIASAALLIYAYSYANGFTLREEINQIVRQVVPQSQAVPKNDQPVANNTNAPSSPNEPKVDESNQKTQFSNHSAAISDPAPEKHSANSQAPSEELNQSQTIIGGAIGGINEIAESSEQTVEQIAPINLPLSETVDSVTDTVGSLLPSL